MTIEQKAKAYDNVIKVIKDNLDTLNEIVETGAEVVNIQSIKNCFYRAFPKLKEMEDERIRKELISFISQDGWKFTKLTKEEKESWIAWLKKQGKPKWSEEDEENFRDIIGAIHCVAYQTSEDEEARIN